jgi:ABC-type Mn2+/Zn2+ transport system permease subunit
VAALLATTSVRATFATAAVLSVALPSLALAVSFYADLPVGPTSVALLVIGVPVAAMTNGLADREGLRRSPTPPTKRG